MVEDAYSLLNNLWEHGSTNQKRKLLRARGLNTSWAETKTVKEMVSRGGGMIASNLLDLNNEYIRRKGAPTVRWDKKDPDELF